MDFSTLRFTGGGVCVSVYQIRESRVRTTVRPSISLPALTGLRDDLRPQDPLITGARWGSSRQGLLSW